MPRAVASSVDAPGWYGAQSSWYSAARFGNMPCSTVQAAAAAALEAEAPCRGLTGTIAYGS